MKIERSPATTVFLTETAKQKKTEKTEPASEPSVVTSFKSTSSLSASDVDMAKVERVKQAIANGEFKIDGDKIADQLISLTARMLSE